MNQFLQMVGTFASIISVPLAVYFYIKTIDNKNNKIKKEIVMVFSNYIGAGGKISRFYLSSVLQAKLTENNLKDESIKESDIINDLVTDILSNTLLSVEVKQSILLEIEQEFNKNIIKAITIPDGKLAGGNVDTASERRRQLAEALRKGEPVIIDSQDGKISKLTKLSESKEVIATIITIVSAILTIFITFSDYIPNNAFLDLTNPFIQVLAGILTTIVVSIIIGITKHKRK